MPVALMVSKSLLLLVGGMVRKRFILMGVEFFVFLKVNSPQAFSAMELRDLMTQ